MTDEAPTPAPPPVPGSALVRMAAGFYAIVALFAFGYALFDWIQRERPLPEDYVFLGLALPSLGLLIAGIAIGLVIVAAVHVGMRSVPGVDGAARELAAMLGPLGTREAIWLAVFSGVGEELLFRGALWAHLGWFGTTLLFGLVHIVPRRTLWTYPLFAAAAGFLLGLLRDTSGSVLPPILAHVTVNAINLAWLGRRHGRLTGTPLPPQDTAPPPPISGGDA